MRSTWHAAAATVLVAVAVVGCNREESKPTPAGTTQTAGSAQVRVAAASDLRFAMDDIAAEFHALHPQIELKPTYGSSGNFYTQLTNKAPFDVFLSADAEYPKRLVEQGLASGDSVFPYAVGHVVLWVPNDSKLDLEASGVRVLADPTVRRIAIANPQHAPYGRAAVAAMKAAGVYDTAAPHLVLGENIGQAAQFVESGSADVGILALSLALSPQMKGKGRYVEIPPNLYPPIEQAGVILSWAADRPAAEDFRRFLLSDAGRQTLSRFGLTAPPAR